ncbi:hypothetical protein TNCV_207121 [Trichonephila clavipes]|nr:hypothetical protein TNCV_207121 [Trichonephila clavipes]
MSLCRLTLAIRSLVAYDTDGKLMDPIYVLPLSNDTRIDDIAEDVEQQLFGTMCVAMFSLHADGLPAGSGDTKFHPLPLYAAESRQRHSCSAMNVVNAGPFRLTLFQC